MNRYLRLWIICRLALTVLAFTVWQPCQTAIAADGVPVEGMFAVNFQGGPSGPGTYDFTVNGIGVLSSVGNSTIQVQKTLDITGKVPIYSGTFTITALNGDTLTGAYQGVGTAIDSGGFSPFSGVLTVTGGTGRFQGASGVVSFSALSNAGTSQAVYSMKGTVQTQ
jgi:hypothetical protein